MNDIFNKKDIPKFLFILIIFLVALAALSLGINIQLKYGYYCSVTVGHSMEKTLNDKSKLLMKKYTGRILERGDIISFNIYTDGEKHTVIKRIIALPNEVINIKGNQVYINNQLLDEEYAYYSKSSEDNLILTLNENEYFVMGDNRCDSLDSRIFGAIPKDIILDTLVRYKN